MNVRFTPDAKDQFLRAVAYIRAENPAAARRFRARAEDVLRNLERFPMAGRTIPEFTNLPFRELIVPPYRFFYRIHTATVWVVAVWHGAQLPDQPVDFE